MEVCSCECIKSSVADADVERLGSLLLRGLPVGDEITKQKSNYTLFRKMSVRIGAYFHVPTFKLAIIISNCVIISISTNTL